MNKTIDIHNVAEYYGDVDTSILQEVILISPNITHFEFNGEQYGVTPKELDRVVGDWQNYLTTRGL